jgi:YHS domain-containing protein
MHTFIITEFFMKKATKTFLLVATLGSLTACAPLITQSPGGALSPVNAVSIGEDKRVMLFGHDVVSYFTENAHKKGSAQFKSQVGEVVFHFSSAANKAAFDKEPNKYVPQYGGFCANGTAYGIPWGGDADTWEIVDGKLYIFGGKASKDAFNLDPKKNRELADQYWKTEIAGSNAFVQRTKRTMISKVPHYKSGDQLAAEVAAKAKK